MEQRSKEWFKIREGRFTASEIHRLLGKGGLARTKQSINSFAFEKAVETLYGREDIELKSADIDRGVTLEPLAFNLFKELKEADFLETIETGFHTFGEDAGASPDGLVSDNSNLEIKCPRRNKFFKIVAEGLPAIDPKYYAQMQMQMLATKTEKSYFVNYHLERGEELHHIIEVPRDEKMIALIEKRVAEASEIKREFIEQIKKNAQF
jgi:putative phage-type endonuclease